MIKLTYTLRRQARMSRKAFQRSWLEEHAPLVRRVQGDLQTAALRSSAYVYGRGGWSG